MSDTTTRHKDLRKKIVSWQEKEQLKVKTEKTAKDQDQDPDLLKKKPGNWIRFPDPQLMTNCRMYNIRAKKQLSQNFLMDPRLLNRIAKVESNDPALESWNPDLLYTLNRIRDNMQLS